MAIWTFILKSGLVIPLHFDFENFHKSKPSRDSTWYMYLFGLDVCLRDREIFQWLRLDLGYFFVTDINVKAIGRIAFWHSVSILERVKSTIPFCEIILPISLLQIGPLEYWKSKSRRVTRCSLRQLEPKAIVLLAWVSFFMTLRLYIVEIKVYISTCGSIDFLTIFKIYEPITPILIFLNI